MAGVYIKGITVYGNEIKSSQYAEGTTMILDGSKKSFISASIDQELFSVISGLWLNNTKTEILWIGNCAGRQDKYNTCSLGVYQPHSVACGIWQASLTVSSLTA